jgi:hypothetical protein
MMVGVKATRGDFRAAPCTDALHSICKTRREQQQLNKANAVPELPEHTQGVEEQDRA